MVPIPEAKRPLDSAAIQVSNQGVRAMTIEDLSSAFVALNGCFERSEGHGTSLYEAVDFNALLRSETYKELIALKKAQTATEQKVAVTVRKITGDTREAVEELHARDAARDATLREQLNGMAAQVEKGHELLAAKGDALKLDLDAAVPRLSQAAGAGLQEPRATPGLINKKLEFLQTAVGGLVARLQSAESKVDTFEAAIKDAQTKIDRLNSSGRTVGAKEPWQPRAADEQRTESAP